MDCCCSKKILKESVFFIIFLIIYTWVIFGNAGLWDVIGLNIFIHVCRKSGLDKVSDKLIWINGLPPQNTRRVFLSDAPNGALRLGVGVWEFIKSWWLSFFCFLFVNNFWDRGSLSFVNLNVKIYKFMQVCLHACDVMM